MGAIISLCDLILVKHQEFASGFQNILKKDDQKILLDACVKFVTIDLRPIYAICGEGLKSLLAAFAKITLRYSEYDINELSHSLPHRNAVRNKIHHVCEEIQFKLKIELKNIFGNGGPGGAFSTDIWTDNFKQQSYICVTVHYIDADFKMHCRTLANSYMKATKKKDGAYICSKIKKVLEKYGILNSPKVIFMSDRGSNMLSGLSDYEHISCALHFLCNCLKKTFKDGKLKTILLTCKKIVCYIKKSSKKGIVQANFKINKRCSV